MTAAAREFAMTSARRAADTPGLPVDTVDGQRIGYVVDVRGPFLRVTRGGLRRDGWLPREYVLSAAEDRLVMEFRKSALRHYLRRDIPAFPEAKASPSNHAA